jgi:hypothetical protein
MLIFFLLKIKSKKVSIYSIYYNDFFCRNIVGKVDIST